MWGLNTSCRKFCLNLNPQTIEESFEQTRAESESVLQFGKDYLNRWQEYNALFNNF